MTPPNEIPLCTSNHCATDVYRERAEDADLSRPAGVAQDNNAEGAFRWSRAMICITQGVMLHTVTTQTIEDFDHLRRQRPLS